MPFERRYGIPWYDREPDPDWVALPVLAEAMECEISKLLERCRALDIPVRILVGPPGERPSRVSAIPGSVRIGELLPKTRRRYG